MNYLQNFIIYLNPQNSKFKINKEKQTGNVAVKNQNQRITVKIQRRFQDFQKQTVISMQ